MTMLRGFRPALAALCIATVMLAACGPEPESPSGIHDQGAPVGGTPVMSCDANTKASFIPDESEDAVVEGGSQGNLNPTNEEMASYVFNNGIGHGIIDSIMPVGDLKQAVLCPDGQIFSNGKKVADSRTNLFTRNPNGAIDGKTVRNPGAILYAHPVHDVLHAPCPATVAIVELDGKIVFVKGVCLSGMYPIDWNGV